MSVCKTILASQWMTVCRYLYQLSIVLQIAAIDYKATTIDGTINYDTTAAAS